MLLFDDIMAILTFKIVLSINNKSFMKNTIHFDMKKLNKLLK